MGGEGQASKQRPNSRKGNAKAVARYSTRFLAPFAGSFEPTKEGYFSLAVRAETSKRASTPSSVKLCACALRLALAIASGQSLSPSSIWLVPHRGVKIPNVHC